MTTDELRAEAEQYIRQDSVGLTPGADVSEVCRQWLADHPTDDAEPLTRDRFFALGWTDAGGLWCSPPNSSGECVTLDYHDNREAGDVYRLIRCGGLPRVEVSTVGDLRRLCAVFGVWWRTPHTASPYPAATSAASAAK